MSGASDPEGAIATCEEGCDGGFGEPRELLRGERRGGEAVETQDPFEGADPEVAVGGLGEGGDGLGTVAELGSLPMPEGEGWLGWVVIVWSENDRDDVGGHDFETKGGDDEEGEELEQAVP